MIIKLFVNFKFCSNRNTVQCISEKNHGQLYFNKILNRKFDHILKQFTKKYFTSETTESD